MRGEGGGLCICLNFDKIEKGKKGSEIPLRDAGSSVFPSSRLKVERRNYPKGLGEALMMPDSLLRLETPLWFRSILQLSEELL